MATEYKGRRIDFYPDDWLGGTVQLSLEEEGAYLRICALIYTRGGPIDNNDRWLAGMCRVSTRKWRSVRQALLEKGKIEVRAGKIYQRRCEWELEKARDRLRIWAEIGSKGGRKSAERRANTLKDKRSAQPDAQAPVNQSHQHTNTASVSNDTAPDRAPGRTEDLGETINLNAIIFGRGKSYLKDSGVPEARAGSLLGAWRKKYGEAAVIAVLAEAQNKAVSDPVAWIIKALERRGQRARPSGHTWAHPRRRDLVDF